MFTGAGLIGVWCLPGEPSVGVGVEAAVVILVPAPDPLLILCHARAPDPGNPGTHPHSRQNYRLLRSEVIRSSGFILGRKCRASVCLVFVVFTRHEKFGRESC